MLIEKEIGNLRFECRTTGKQGNPAVLYLHGWPETSFMWKKLMEEMAGEGFFNLAFNMRGFSPGARPKGRKNYKIELLCQDVLDIADAFGLEQFHLVGHDWGSAIGWALLQEHSARILSWTGMSVPHPVAFSDAINNDPVQAKMSRYMRLFRWPFIPEIVLASKDFAIFRKNWEASSPEEQEDYFRILGSRKSIKFSLNYYRANYNLFKNLANTEGNFDVHCPTLFIWGKNDVAISKYGIDAQEKFMKGFYKLLVLDAGHWLIQTAFPEIKKALLAHLRQDSSQ